MLLSLLFYTEVVEKMKKVLFISLVIIMSLGLSGIQVNAQSQEAKLTASDSAAYDRFGNSVSVSDDTIVVGAEYGDGNDENSGSAYVFVRNGTGWVQQEKLIASDGEQNDAFGNSVSTDSDTIVIGAPTDNGISMNSGSAYVFVRDDSSWIEQPKLTASDEAASDFFGRSISVSGDIMVIGAHGDDDSGTNSGSAYVFVRNGSGWSQQQKLIADDGETGDQFGMSVSTNGDIMVIGAFGDDDQSGSAYVFVRDGFGWSQQKKLIASDRGTGDKFGMAVAADGETIVIGSCRDDDTFSNSGSAYVFVFDGLDWIEQQKLTASDGAKDDAFGYSVGINGNKLIVAAYSDDDNGSNSGSAYIFVHDGSNWAEEQKLIASDGESYDLFGCSVSIDEGTVTVGAKNDDDKGSLSGSVYVYSINANVDPVELIDDLGDHINDLDLPENIEDRLGDKLALADKVLTDDNERNDVAAVNTLEAFINQVEAQRGKKISEEDAVELIAMAEAIIAELGS